MPSRESPGVKLAALERKVKRLSMVDGLQHSTITNGSIKEVDDEGRVVAIIGKQPDGSHAIVPLDGPTPLQATAPVCKGGAFAIDVTWDGNLISPVTGVVDAELDAYEDTEAGEVHVGDVVDFVPADSTRRGALLGRLGGEVSVAAGAGEKFVRIVIRSKAGKLGPPSDVVAVTVSPIVPIDQFDDAMERLRGENIEGLQVENLVVTDTANINELVVQALAARTAEFMEIAANQILAGDITVVLRLLAEGLFQVGAEDVGLDYITMENGTFSVWTAGGADGQLNRKLISIGRNGRGLWTVTDADGGVLSQIREDGSAAFIEVDAEILRASGMDVADAILGQPRVITNEIYPNQSPQYDNNFGNYEIAFEAEPNHTYELETFGNVRTDGNSIRISGRYKESTTGSPSAPDRNSPETSQAYSQEAGSQYRIASAKFYYRTTSSNMKVRLLTCFEPNSEGKWAQVSYWRHILRDLGLDERETIGQANPGGAVPMGSTTPDPTPTLPPLKEYTKTWNFESHTLWTQNGRVTGSQYHPSWMRSGMGGSSRYRGYMWLPQAFRDERDIAESISSIEVYLAVAEVGPAVSPAYGTSNSTTMSTEPGSGNFNTRNPYSNDRKSGWEYMTGATRNGLDGTALMLAIGDKVSNANLVSFHGPDASVSLRPKIRMTYKKRG